MRVPPSPTRKLFFLITCQWNSTAALPLNRLLFQSSHSWRDLLSVFMPIIATAWQNKSSDFVDTRGDRFYEFDRLGQGLCLQFTRFTINTIDSEPEIGTDMHF